MSKRLYRFIPVQRLFHGILVLSFLIQAASGLGRMYMETPWGKGLCLMFGGYDGAGTVHLVTGLFMLGVFAVHLIYLMGRIPWRQFPGSASLETVARERPAWLDRLKADGKLRECLTGEVPRTRKALYLVVGYAAMAVGLYLLVGAFFHATRISW